MSMNIQQCVCLFTMLPRPQLDAERVGLSSKLLVRVSNSYTQSYQDNFIVEKSESWYEGGKGRGGVCGSGTMIIHHMTHHHHELFFRGSINLYCISHLSDPITYCVFYLYLYFIFMSSHIVYLPSFEAHSTF